MTEHVQGGHGLQTGPDGFVATRAVDAMDDASAAKLLQVVGGAAGAVRSSCTAAKAVDLVGQMGGAKPWGIKSR
jgi:hypothetical protein